MSTIETARRLDGTSDASWRLYTVAIEPGALRHAVGVAVDRGCDLET